jgi:hypothetical protein
MTLREAAEALAALVAQHPELADVVVEYDADCGAYALDGKLSLVEQDVLHTYKHWQQQDPACRLTTATRKVLFWNRLDDSSDDEKILATYPLCPAPLEPQ